MTVAKPKQCHLGSLVDRSKTSITHLTNQKSRRNYVTRRRLSTEKRRRKTACEHRRISGYPACLRRRYFGGDIQKPEVRLRYGLWLDFLKIWLARVISSCTKFSWMETSASSECLQVSTTRLVLISLAFSYWSARRWERYVLHLCL